MGKSLLRLPSLKASAAACSVQSSANLYQAESEDCILEFTVVCNMGLIFTNFLCVVITVRRHFLHLLKELKAVLYEE